MPNNFQDWTSLLANICTIIAFLFAIVIWREWKAQENYSFIRDNIFELELKSAYSYITMIQLMTCYFNYCYEKINGNNSEMEKHLKEYEEYYTKWLEDNFIFKANYIVVSNLLYNKFFKINHEDFRRLDVDLIGKINDFKDRMNAINSQDALTELFKAEQSHFKNMLIISISTMDKIRNNL